MVPGHAVAMTHPSAGEVFLHTSLLPFPTCLLIGPGQLYPKTMGHKSCRGFRDLCTVPRVLFDRK